MILLIKKTFIYFLGWFCLTFLIVISTPALATNTLDLLLQNKSFLSTQIPSNHAQSLLEQGKILYEKGLFIEAIKTWQSAEQIYAQKGDVLNQALVLNWITNSAEELGDLSLAETTLKQSFQKLDLIPNSPEKTRITAIIYTTKGTLQLALGQPEIALKTWQEAEQIYTSLKDEQGIIGSQINQAQALQNLGQYRRAKNLLETINQNLELQPDSLLKATALQNLGVTLSVVGDLNQSRQVLEQSLAIFERFNAENQIADLLLNLANTKRGIKNYKAAEIDYQRCITLTKNLLLKTQAEINQFSLAFQTKNKSNLQQLSQEIEQNINKLTPSRPAIYAQVNFAHHLIEADNIMSQIKIANILAKAINQAQNIQDKRAEAYALCELGKLYAKNQQLTEAEQLIEKAIKLAETTNSQEIMGSAQAELGRILQKQGKTLSAINSYQEAVQTWQDLRRELVAMNPDLQFSFRESVEPVYRELVGLLLDEQVTPEKPITQANLIQARKIMENLQLAELDNFFREACLDVKPQQIDQIDPQAAIIYPIVLNKSLEVILSLPGKPLQHYQTILSPSELQKKAINYYHSINYHYSNRKHQEYAKELYDLLLKPAEKHLTNTQVKTLVIVPDSQLRSIPMAALYDGNKYLIEKYNLVVTPGLQLLPPKGLEKRQYKILTAGLTEARQGFSQLPGVELELANINQKIQGKTFLNQEFTEQNLQQNINKSEYNIVHLATHGQFSSEPEETFILTWEDKIKVNELEDLLRSGNQQEKVIELLVLSACETAAGDQRAALGLAGVALRSGARSTVGTLWAVQDDSTAQLMSDFYEQLSQTGITKAAALRHAQLSLLQQKKFQHPFYWAPFILIGNWL